MTHVMSQLERDFAKELGVPRDKWDSDAENAFQDRVSDMAKVNYFGFDINPDLVKATKMNMVMNNDGSGNILNLLRAEDSEGASYRDNVANLHEALQNAALMTQEYIGARQAISFSSVASKNLNAAERFDYYKNHYERTRTHGKIITSVKEKSTGVEIFHFEQDEYDKEALQQQSVYVSLTPTQQESCLRCYGKMTPYVIESVLSKPEDVGSPDRSKKIGAYSFVKDDVKISRAIVVVLYMLRCCLAHGDFSPDEASNNVYKYAYEVLCVPLKKLR